MPSVLPYNRSAALSYARRWAYSRNPSYYSYDEIGGDCTNFASQCLYAGTGMMNFTPEFGWYYRNANDKAPAWTGVEFFGQFLLRNELNTGPFAAEIGMSALQPGDFILLSFNGTQFSHTLIVTASDRSMNPDRILVASHSYDAYHRPLRTYPYQEILCLHILGAYYPDTM